MSRRVGAYTLFTIREIAPEYQALLDGASDLTPAMQEISLDATQRGREQAVNNPEWPALEAETVARKRRRGGSLTIGMGTHGGFAPTIRPFAGKLNAGWKTRAPHAHLFALGTKVHVINGRRVNVYNDRRAGRKHLSRAKSRSLLTKVRSRQHQPARPFDYIADEDGVRYQDIVLAYLTSLYLGRPV